MYVPAHVTTTVCNVMLQNHHKKLCIFWYLFNVIMVAKITETCNRCKCCCRVWPAGM